MLYFIQTIVISLIILFLLHQIYLFLQKMIQPPKIKTPLIEKYKSLLSSAAAAAIPIQDIGKLPAAAATAAMEDITDDFYDTSGAASDDNESVYSAGYVALRDEMGDELAELIV
jgi:hypothetical protein